MKKIVLIGPVYPYKGGISHYTGMMCRALQKKYEVIVVSFRMQYPGILFHKEQKDYSNDSFRIENANYWIHTANPLNWLITARKIGKLKPDLIICQWWHPYFAPCYYMLQKFLRGFRWLFLCHNVFPHERFPMDRSLSRMALKGAAGYIVQSGTDAAALKSIVKAPVFEQAVHPTYNAFRMEGMGREKGRQLLGLGSQDKVLLFFGFVREYKGLAYLLRAMPRMRQELKDIRLLVVGDFGGGREKYIGLIEELQIQEAVGIYDGYIPDREVEKFFAACDLVVLPYLSATQSGIVQIAYGFEKPVVATQVGGLPDVVTDGRTGYVIAPGDSGRLADAVIRFYRDGMAEEMEANVKKEAYRFSWDRLTETVERLEGSGLTAREDVKGLRLGEDHADS